MMLFEVVTTAAVPVAGAATMARGMATPPAMVPAATADRMARVMSRFARIESSKAYAQVRSLRRANSTAQTTALSYRVVDRLAVFPYSTKCKMSVTIRLVP